MTSPKPVSNSAPIPANEAERLMALYRYRVLDTPPEMAFDRITALASRLFQVPIALVSLVDQSRAWFKSCLGFSQTEVKRDETICSFAVLYNDVMVVLDPQQDPRFSCNPFVLSEPGLRFYAGAPLITPDGFNLGTLCLLDTEPHSDFSAEQQTTLLDLAAMVVDELELRLSALRIAQSDAAMLEITQGVSAATGEAFFYALVQHFAKVLNVDYAYIGLLHQTSQGADQIRTLAVSAHGEIAANFEYLLADTPCQEVLRQRRLCCYPHNVQDLFPQAPLLRPLQIQSYVAIPFYNSAGQPLGLLGIMHCQPLDNVQLAEYLLPIFALRIVAELERQQAEQQQAEMLLREQEARQQAEVANRIKDEFLAVLSHELRTPLSPILGWTQLLKSGKCRPDRMQQALETIERNAKLQTQLIEDLLDMSRILRGKLTLEILPVDLQSVVEAAVETVQLAAEAKAMVLQVNYTDPVQVMGDRARLQQVIWNLLSNAIKFTPEGGKIVVTVQRQPPDQLDCSDHSLEYSSDYGTEQASTPRPDYVEITVADTGKGIRPDFLPHVFDTFRQADSTTTRQFGGLGLGLAIVRQIVELHGGTVWAESSGEGQGACFTIRLPLSAPVAPLPLDPHVADYNLDAMQILVIDDDADSRELITFILEEAGALVQSVSSGTEALQWLQAAVPDCIISDIGMPELDGYQLMQMLRADHKTCSVPAIALSAYAGEYNQRQAQAAGFQKHMAKPADPTVLVQTVASLRQG
jgi:signal transduction histidine kinase